MLEHSMIRRGILAVLCIFSFTGCGGGGTSNTTVTSRLSPITLSVIKGTHYNLIPFQPLPGDNMISAVNVNNQGVVLAVSFTGGFDPPSSGGSVPKRTSHIYSQNKGRGLLITGQTETPININGGTSGPISFAGITDNGTVVGEDFTNNSGVPFQWINGATSVLAGIPHNASLVSANNDDQIVGVDPSNNGFIWQNGTFTALSLQGSGAAYGIPTGLNLFGDVVGYYIMANRTTSAVLWQHGAPTDLGAWNGGTPFLASYAYAINNNGGIAGEAVDLSGAVHAVVWQAGQYTDLTPLIGGYGFAVSINRAGDVVGNLTTGSAFLVKNGSCVNLTPLFTSSSGLQIDSAMEINDLGQILVTYSGSGSNGVGLIVPNGT